VTDVDARQQIHDALLTYCRGIDRLDPEAIAAAFHPDAELIDYGAETLTIEAFAEYAVASLGKRFRATQHRISNTRIEFDGDRALVETYVLAYHVEPTDDGDVLHTFDGRYIDRFELRDGAWLIASRTLRNDWSRVEPIDTPMRGAWVASGRGGSPDPIYD
jgi:uncharacterized protein (TIGR02246 family)